MVTGDCIVMFLAALMLFWLVHSLRHSFECTNMASYLCDVKAARFRMKQVPIWAAIKAAIVQPCLTEFKDTGSNPCRSGFLSKLWYAHAFNCAVHTGECHCVLCTCT